MKAGHLFTPGATQHRQPARPVASGPTAAILAAACALAWPATAQAERSGHSEAADAAPCPPPQTSDRLIVLDEGCVYDAPIVLKTSGAALDCRGALIDLRRRHRFGIEIGVEAGVRDVTVRNCRIANAASSGVAVGWQAPASVREKKYTEEERYAAATRKVTLDNVTSTDNDIAGIYILAYSQDVRITGSHLSRNAGVGVYIGPQSMRTTVEDSELGANGLGSPRHERRGLGRREAVAIDASSDNVIRRNTFRGNGGAVYLYKNCQEMVSGHGRNFKRTKPSERNRIEDNTIQGSLIGVWAASRQSRILSSSDCGDPYYGDGNYVLDRAPDNIIARNVFSDVGVAAVIEDDGNRFVDNVISGAASSCAVVGTGPRSEKLGRPVVDVVVARNRCQSGRDGYVFAFGAPASGFAANELNGQEASPTAVRCAGGVMPFKGLGYADACSRAQ